uniref:Uncharacterized protein n=1 Tax=Scophthalmus maximus TaxID=52904 RepID=A0A8D3D4I5_SCOMX
MDRFTVVNYCLGLLGLLLLQGVLNVDGRSMFNSGNHFLNPKEDTDAQSKILALLLHKSLVPVEKDDPLGERQRTQTLKTHINTNTFLRDDSFFFLHP